MSSPIPVKDKLIVAIGYALPIVFPIPLFTILFVFIYYYFLGDESRFVHHHLKQNFNVVLSYHLYMVVLLLVIFLFSIFENVTAIIMAYIPFLGLLVAMGGFFSFFILILSSFILIGVLIVLIILAACGKWTRVPLIIRCIK
ncbi:DUF4870 domain-containing protein [Texcoconibacillus texcoconensis]|uniref:Putative Tic20 family protein n=1 Tax=Texcoconibacillus texcoconensis TaxID=1095777 RepID=A0A840QM92_9BACI|nr:DUF4870 domain-containing protein [Texcoconibacillus texcoconensis]MBB5172487.1 putative Tic20 family protein [Texcoconibacillus texcoconensis]